MANEVENKIDQNQKFVISFIITPTVCEEGANAAYESVKNDGGSDKMAQNAYNAALKACESQMKESNLEEKIDRLY